MEQKELPDIFDKDMKIGDELIVLGKHVRIDAIELVIHTRRMINGRPTRSRGKVAIPVKNFDNPFPWGE